MAEVVQYHVEQMLPELEQMQRVGLFTPQEIRAIIRKRRQLEYRVRRRIKHKQDYLKYIQYEISLLKLISKRRKRIGYQHKKKEIERILKLRIKRLFQRVVYRYQSDVNLWLDYISFLKELKWKAMVSRVFVRMLAVHPSKESLWIAAAKYEFEENNITGARSLMLSGLRHHPSSLKLYMEYFRLELLYADFLRKQQEDLGVEGEKDEAKDAVMQGHLAEVIYVTVMKENPQPQLLTAFLSICKEFDFTQDLQNSILSSLKEEFLDYGITWDTLARLELENSNTIAGKECLKRCRNIYEEAVEKLQNSSEIWEFYLDTMWSVYKKRPSRKQRSRFCKLCSRAAVNAALKIERYETWINLLTEDQLNREALKVCNIALEAYPKHQFLWKKIIELMLLPDNDCSSEDIIKMIKTALQILHDKTLALHLFSTILQWMRKTFSKDKIRNLIIEIIESGNRELVQELRSVYLKWVADSFSTEAAWKVFVHFHNQPPFSLPLHTAMLDLYGNSPQSRKVFVSATEHFGKVSIDIWLRWIEWEESYGSPLECIGIYQRAVKTLQPDLVDAFIMNSTLKQSNS